MFCFVAIASTYIFGTLLTANGSLKTLNQLAIGGVLINFILNLVLIPELKAEGSALASLITQFLIVIAQILVMKKVFSFRTNFKFIGLLIIYILLLLVGIYQIGILFTGFFIQLLIFAVISLLLGFALRIFCLKEIHDILSDKQA